MRKFKGKVFSDARRRAEDRNLKVRDVVLRKQDVITNVDSTFHYEPYKIVETSGPQMTAELPKEKSHELFVLQEVGSSLDSNCLPLNSL